LPGAGEIILIVDLSGTRWGVTLNHSYKYFTFSYSIIFKLVFLFPFKLREELLYFKKSWLSILEVKVKHYLSLIYSFKKLLILIILLYKSLGKENLTN